MEVSSGNSSGEAWYREGRARFQEILAQSIPLPEEFSLETSPCRNYQIFINKYLFQEGPFRLARAEVRCHDGSLITTVESNLGFNFSWVPPHPNGLNHLICHEDYQGFSVVELETGRRVDYIPPEAEQGLGFCQTRRYFSRDGRLLYVLGCIWAHEYEVIVYDFGQPMSPPYPQLWRGFGDGIHEVKDDGSLVFSNLEYVLEEDGSFVGDQEYTYLLTPQFEVEILKIGPLLVD